MSTETIYRRTKGIYSDGLMVTIPREDVNGLVHHVTGRVSLYHGDAYLNVNSGTPGAYSIHLGSQFSHFDVL